MKPFRSTHLSDVVDHALIVAALAHEGQVRKGTRIPYVMHPFHVALSLDRHGYPESVVIAGALHDVLEDMDYDSVTVRNSFAATFPALSDAAGHPATFRDAMPDFIRDQFGADVLRLVESVTEKKEDDSGKRPWRVRKDEQLADARTMAEDAIALKAADALHNAASVRREIESRGRSVLDRFNCAPEETLWYYGSIADLVRDRLGARNNLAIELDETVHALTEAISNLPADNRADASFVRVETSNGSRIYSLAHWRRVAPPVGKDSQWKNGRSAKELARAWSQLSAPADVLDLLRGADGLGDLQVEKAIAEFETTLDSFGKGRNHDLLILGHAAGKRILVGVEAKADEELGPAIGAYRASAETANQARREAGSPLSRIPERIDGLASVVFGDRGVDISPLRYQLLHGLVGTLLEAARRGTDAAVFLVHEFTSARTSSKKVEQNEAALMQFAAAISERAPDVLRSGKLAGPFLAHGGGDLSPGFPFYLGLLRTELGQLASDAGDVNIVRVLGIDIASAAWNSNGSAIIEFDPDAQAFTSVQAPAIGWPNVQLTPGALAEAIDEYVRANDICAVALDGPQGWRDPATALDAPGVGRRCEHECATQGKTGTYKRTFPANQLAWIEFCVETFAALLAKPDVQLADPKGPLRPPAAGYVLVECFPTSAWRSSGLKPLPGKAKRAPLEPYITALADAYGLPGQFAVAGHDDLQAVVAALTASAAVGGPARPLAKGVPATRASDPVAHLVEGYIWDIEPVRSGR
jgi:hypothetical protein